MAALFSPIQAAQLQQLAATNPNMLFAGMSNPPPLPPGDMDGYDKTVEQIESGGDQNASNPQSSATGLYQITDPTLQGIYKNHPELAGLGPNDQRVMDALTQDNAQELRLGLGRQPTAADLYAAHFLGGPTAVKFLQADPNAPASSVVPQEFALRNANVFTGAHGNPLTVGQLMQAWQQKFGGTGGAGNPTGAPATTAGSPLSYASMFPSAESVYGPMKSALAAYMQSQPGMWDKLEQMRQDYVKNAQVSPVQRAQDAINALAQGNDAAAGLRNATAGGVLLHALPNMQPSIEALQNAHNAQVQQRQQALRAGEVAYQTGAHDLLARNAQALENMKASQGLAQSEAGYAMNAGKLGLELAKFGNQQATAFTDYATKLIPNPETRAAVMSKFTQIASPTSSLAQNMQVLNGLVKQAQAGGSQIGEFSPGQEVLETYFDDKTQQPVRRVINTSTPAGQAELANRPKNASLLNMTAPQSNVSVTNNPAGGEAAEGKAQHTPEQVYNAAQQTIRAAQAALQILPYLKAAGGTGAITDSDQARQIYTTLQQVLGYDPHNIALRSIYDKLMNQLQVAAILPSMAAMGRGTGGEFQKMLKGQVGADYNSQTASTFLQHMIRQAQWDANYQLASRKAQVAAKQANNGYWDAPLYQMQYMQKNPIPSWDMSGLGVNTPDPNAGKSSADLMVPQPPAATRTIKTPNGGQQQFIWDGQHWRYAQ